MFSLPGTPRWRWHVLTCLGILLVSGQNALLTAAENGEAKVELEALPEPDINWAKEQQFWSYRAPVAHPRPEVKNQRWPAQPIDYFVLARLEQQRLTPSTEADRRTLIRRLTLDLTGLPPTPEAVTAFLADKKPGAYERLVERLLANAAFGERMASLWLPLARYAEDQAHQVGTDTKYFYPNAWRYREWVINAFNRDLPYDQFIRLQLAADKTANPSPDDLAALGFVGLGPKYYNRNRTEVKADEWEDRVDTVSRAMLGLTVACARCHDHKFEPITQHDYYAMAGIFASTRMVNQASGKPVDDKLNADKMPAETLHIVEDGEAQKLNVFIRGNVNRKGPEVEHRFLRILSQGDPKTFAEGSGRKELAEAIVDPANPLTSRVMVNRVWGMFFGKPLVATPSNFGHSGSLPTHPELFDDLAVRFMRGGWSVKSLVRELVLSSAYRQSSQGDAKKETIDASNESLWKMNRRRLSIEQWRDSVLFVSGELDQKGGASLELDDAKNLRRTVYARVSRLKLNDLLMQFDYPDANVHAEGRALTTTPMQKLFMLNSPFMVGQTKAFAEELAAQAKSDEARIRLAYQTLFGRDPDKTEARVALEFLRKPASPEMPRWEQYAQMLLVSNEMLYVD